MHSTTPQHVLQSPSGLITGDKETIEHEDGNKPKPRVFVPRIGACALLEWSGGGSRRNRTRIRRILLLPRTATIRLCRRARFHTTPGRPCL